MQTDYTADSAKPDAPSAQVNQDLRDYKAFGSFAPVYTDAKRRIWDSYSVEDARPTLFVLDALAQHAGPTGIMWRLSWREIMRTSHLRFERAQEAMRRLIYDLDYIREHRVSMPTRGKDIVDWQLSPYVLWIAPPVIHEAVGLWASAKQPEKLQNVSAAETQPESEPRFRNQKQEPDESTRRVTRNSLQEKGHSRWFETPIDQCQNPLKAADEMVAKMVAQGVGTGITQARQMILTYGVTRVTLKLDEVKKQMLRTKVHKPGALLLTTLRTAYGRKQPTG